MNPLGSKSRFQAIFWDLNSGSRLRSISITELGLEQYTLASPDLSWIVHAACEPTAPGALALLDHRAVDLEGGPLSEMDKYVGEKSNCWLGCHGYKAPFAADWVGNKIISRSIQHEIQVHGVPDGDSTYWRSGGQHRDVTCSALHWGSQLAVCGTSSGEVKIWDMRESQRQLVREVPVLVVPVHNATVFDIELLAGS